MPVADFDKILIKAQIDGDYLSVAGFIPKIDTPGPSWLTGGLV